MASICASVLTRYQKNRLIICMEREREVYEVVLDIASMNNDTNFVSSSLGLVEIIIELPIGSLSDKVMSYDSTWLTDLWVIFFKMNWDCQTLMLRPTLFWSYVSHARNYV